MKKFLLVMLAVVLLIIPLALSELETQTTSYTLKIAATGETTALINIQGGETYVPLPKDVLSPQVKGGSYQSYGEGVVVTPEEGKTATLAFRTSYFTDKDDGVWYVTIPGVQQSVVKVILPDSVRVVQSSPKAFITKDKTLALQWDSVSSNISFSYVPVNEEELFGEELPGEKNNWLAMGIILFLLLLVGSRVYVLLKRRKSTTAITIDKDDSLSERKLDVIRAVSHNEGLIIREILKNNGHIKRNVLEQKTNVSKSSLASSLNNLEKKNIIEIDRSFHVHYITFSQWFKEL